MSSDTDTNDEPHIASGPAPTNASNVAPRPTKRSWALGALGGVVAAGAGLGVAELVAGTSRQLQSPVLDVGDRFIDLTPRPLKEQAIQWFGTNDKKALLVGIAIILIGYAMFVGVLALRRRLLPAMIGIGAFGLVGAVSSVTTRRQAPLVAIIPSVVGAVIAAGVLVVLHRVAYRDQPSTAQPLPTTADSPSTSSIAQLVPNDRRRFLAAVGIAGVAATAAGISGRKLKSSSGAAASRNSLSLPLAEQPLDAAPSTISTDAVGANPFFTPNANFYRIDTALTVPQIPLDDWSLKISGLVDNPTTLSFQDLISRELVEADITLTCVSNEVGGTLMGTARWLGIRLDDLLNDVGVKADADQIVGRSIDGYSCGFPVSALDGRNALIAIGMNGEPLPLEHGFPARLIVPGLYGYVSATKWLTELNLTRFDQFDQYWVERGWVDNAPIKLSSRIDTPRGLSKVAAGTIAIAGVAWSQTVGINAVEVSIDDGPWQPTTLADELNNETWRQWSFAWDAAPGRHGITVRAIDKNGAIQTDTRSEPFPSGATGQHQIVVIVK